MCIAVDGGAEANSPSSRVEQNLLWRESLLRAGDSNSEVCGPVSISQLRNIFQFCQKKHRFLQRSQSTQTPRVGPTLPSRGIYEGRSRSSSPSLIEFSSENGFGFWSHSSGLLINRDWNWPSKNAPVFPPPFLPTTFQAGRDPNTITPSNLPAVH